MSWRITSDPDEYAAAAGAFLREQRALHTIQLTVLEGLRAAGSTGTAGRSDAAPMFGWWRTPTGVVGSAFLHTPPWPVVLDAAPDQAVDALTDLLADRRQLPGVNADPATAKRLADGWRQRTGDTVTARRRQRLYRLARLIRPDPASPGRPRLAVAADRGLLLAWLEAFHRELGETRWDLAAAVDDRLGHRGYTLWEVDGSPVALAGMTRKAAGMVRVGPVYTPPQQRRRGYAGAVTAEVSQAAIDAGAGEVVLFTDLGNPTSNALYQRLGYRPVADRVVLSFTAAPLPEHGSAWSMGHGNDQA